MKKLLLSVLLVCMSPLAFAAAPITQIQAMLDKSPVLCGNFDQSKQLVGNFKTLTLKRPILCQCENRRRVANTSPLS